MSDSNRLQVSVTEETTWGITPSNAFEEIPVTGGGMNLETETIRSNAIRSDGQRAGAARVNTTPNASFEFEFVADVFDELMARAIRNTTGLSADVNISGTTFACVASGNKITDSGSGLAGIAVGQWVYVAGFTTAGNNGWKKATAVAAGEITVAGSGLTDEAAGDSVTIKGQVVENGSASPSYTIQQQHLDETNRFEVITGARIASLALDIASRSMITGSMSWTGKDFDATASSKAGNGTVNAAATQPAMAEVDAFDGFFVDGDVVSAYELLSVGFEVSTPTREQTGLGSIAKLGVPLGNLEASGSIEVYKEDDSWSLLTNYAAFTAMSFAFALVNENGDRYLIEFPKIYLSNESGGHPGPDADTLLSFSFEAEPDAATSKTVRICKVNA